MRICLIGVVAFAAAASGTALASPRDDVLDAMLRCAKIADDAARHACFDAAIPQLRAAAQTPPVETAAQPAPVTPPTSAPQQTASAEAPQGSQDSSIFDSIGGIGSSLNPFGGGSDDDKPSAQQMAYQAMGAEILPITIGVADYTTGPHGYTVTLDNGQVWQNYPRLVDAPPFSASEKNVVTISHAMLGGYNLVLKGRGRPTLFKVVRVK